METEKTKPFNRPHEPFPKVSESRFNRAFSEAADGLKELSKNATLLAALAKMTDVIVQAYQRGGCLYLIGNGGSAADAQHIAAELMGKLGRNRSPIKAFALTTDTSFLTACGNDFGYEYIFSRQVEGAMNKEDVLLALSTSGMSPSIVKGLEAARSKRCSTLLLTGPNKASDCVQLSDIVAHVSGKNSSEIQQGHLVIYHTLCELIEDALVFNRVN